MRIVGVGGRLEPLRLRPGQRLVLLAQIVEDVGDNCVVGLMAGGAHVQIVYDDVDEDFENRRTVRDALELEEVES